MRAAGIVCEYNPFHRGHLHQIEETRRRLGEDTAVICAMSGDFVQRGEAALFDKFLRAEAACRCGASLVVELPLPWCLSSAEGFAKGAVSLLDALGCEVLSFGSESGDLEALKSLAGFASDPATLARIYALMDGDGSLSFARARQLAAREALGETAELLSKPNDILAVEYLKALGSTGMEPIAVRRIGSFHDSPEDGACLSALRLRELAEKGEDLSPHVPTEAAELYREAIRSGRVRNRRLLEIALLSRLYLLGPEDFDRLPDAGGGAGRRLYKALEKEESLEGIVGKASSKRFTAARMRRMLLCAALGVCVDDTRGSPPYLRVLASDERGRAWLRSRRGTLCLPLLNRAADLKTCDAAARRSFTLGARAHELYQLQFVAIDDRKRDGDWKNGPAIVKNA